MMKKFYMGVVGLLIVCLAGCISYKKENKMSQPDNVPSTLSSFPAKADEKAVKAMESVANGEYAKVYGLLSPGFRKSHSENNFIRNTKIFSELGTYQSSTVTDITQEKGITYVFLNSFYQKGTAKVKLYIDNEGCISGYEYTIKKIH